MAVLEKLLVHFITLPLFTIIWITSFYWICDQLGLRRAQGSQIIWDFYINSLFYIIQFGVLHLSDYYKRLKKQELVAAQLSKLNLQSELSALKAQINPHFLYNVFNTINAAIPTTANNARDMVNKLSDLFRYQLKASREEVVPLKEELEFVRKYLELEKERFGDRLSFEIYVDNELLEVFIPPMLIQPIIENSVKHGISPLIEGGKITMNIYESDNNLEVVIKDTGAGIKNLEKENLFNSGVGLSNTNKRLQKMYGQEITIESNLPKGLVVKFSLPMNKT